MKDYTKKQKILIVLGLAVFILIGSGITYAGLMWATSNPINIGLTSGCFEINYTPGGAINNANVEVMDESTLINNNKFTITEGIALTYANIGIKSTCTVKGYGSLYLNVTSLSSAFSTGSSKGSLKYAILNNTSSSTTLTVAGLKGQSFDIVKTGTITSTGTVNILNRQLYTTQDKYLIVFYIDGALIGNDVVGSTFDGNISADAHQGTAPYEGLAKLIANDTFKSTKTVTLNNKNYRYDTTHNLMEDTAGNISADAHQGKAPYEGLAKLIANDTFKSTKTVTLNNKDYRYDTTHNLMEDTAGNIRYYGANPNNYIYFNCSDYSNQTSSTCETWRIIGVFDGNVKIMSGSVIGSYSWDSSASDVNYGWGVNEWSQADLMKLLNSGYDSESVGGSLYWNAKSGTCYNGQNNATTSCNFTSTGLKNPETRNMIAETTYYTRGHNTTRIYANAMYDKERVSGTVITGVTPTRTLTWTGKVAIPYPSDYGYAADLSLCQKELNSYIDATCTANNWMKNILAPNYGWLLTPNSGYASSVWGVSSGSVSNGSNAYGAYGVAPVLSLTSELDIGPGTGTSSSPYQLSVN